MNRPELVVSFPGGKRVDAEFLGHTIYTDQPHRAGGENSAPAPFSLFLASIGTCAGIYVLGFLQSRNLPTEDVRIVARPEFDRQNGVLRSVDIHVELPPEIPEKYYSAIKRAADMCAVKKAIEAQPDFDVLVSATDRQQQAQAS